MKNSPLPIKKVLVPLDFSSPALTGWKEAVALAEGWGAQVEAVCVMPRRSRAWPPRTPSTSS